MRNRSVLVFGIVAIALSLGCAAVLGRTQVAGLTEAAGAPECGSKGLSVARRTDVNATSVASFVTTAGQFVAWEEASSQFVKPISPQRLQAARDRVAMCYYDGVFEGFPMPPGSAVQYTRMLIIVLSDGSTRLVSVGPKIAIPLIAPAP